MDPKLKGLIFKTSVFVLSLIVAWWLIKSGHLESITLSILPLRFVAEIVAGILYTSFLTSPISVAMLIVLASENNPVVTAFLAGFGAVLGDLLIVKFFRKEAQDIDFIARQLHFQKINKILHKLHLDFLTPLFGVIIVASPFPDELGLMMLGASKLKYQEIALLSYILNTAGILIIVAPANLLL